MHTAPGSNREWPIRVAIATLCLAVHGCDTVTGGAVELSWKLRPASSSREDKFVDCDSSPFPVTQIRLHWQVDDEPEQSQAWLCQYNHGVTGFDLTGGTAQLWVTPECETGDPRPEAYIAPAKVERMVSRGDTVSLGAVEIVVAVTDCKPREPDGTNGPTRPCICDP
jgi:hypothetical protein